MSTKLNAAKIRPREPLLLSAGIALFAGIVAIIATREIALSLIIFGIGFIVSVILFATFLLLIPNDDVPQAREEIFIPVLMRDQDGVDAGAGESVEAGESPDEGTDARRGSGVTPQGGRADPAARAAGSTPADNVAAHNPPIDPAQR